ncbi:Lsr2 dimerization domain-containing protein [Amycolatopsis taiwanensis]|uniref:Lsr2 dimerization domain-containing protein n=1 Tax=Amycolatopsis taiwanensis TaxID=342230 RepID=UPI0004875674|nr:histone-like nucleoid-structuring protein Lsr2 [Amycolatopsis taiwanensis]
MAKKVSVVDDFDNDTLASETVIFAFDGENLAVDLCEENALGFRELMAPYLEVATKLGKHKLDKRPINGKKISAPVRPQTAKALPASSGVNVNGEPWYRHDRNGDPSREKAKKRYRDMVRQFGLDAGYDLGERGVIPADVYAAFEQHRREEGLPVGPKSVGLA